MLMQLLKVIVVNRETASYERARNKGRKGQILSAAAAPGSEWNKADLQWMSSPAILRLLLS